MDLGRAGTFGGVEQQSEIDREIAFTDRTWHRIQECSLALTRCNTVLCASNDRMAVSGARIAETRERILSSRLVQARCG
jgi:hypothetical protein